MKRFLRVLRLCLLFMLPALTAGALVLQNSILKITVDVAGGFRIRTTGGDPENEFDNNTDLLNNKVFGSSYILVNVDGKLGKFGWSMGKNLGDTAKKGDALVTRWRFAGVLFTQEVSLYRGYYADKPNLARIQLKAKNVSPSEKKIGFRVVLDTSLGPDDGLGLFLPHRGLVRKGLAILEEREIPTVFYVLNWSERDGASLELNLHGRNLVRPDRIYFAKHRLLKNDKQFSIKKDNELSTDFTGESAFALVWEPKAFPAGAEDGIALGIGAAVYPSRKLHPLRVSFAAPQMANSEEIWLAAVAEHLDKYWNLKDIHLQIQFDGSCFRLVQGERTRSLRELEGGKKAFAAWKLKPLKDGSSELKLIVRGKYRNQPVSLLLRRTVRVKL